jgi:hypothetical protein
VDSNPPTALNSGEIYPFCTNTDFEFAGRCLEAYGGEADNLGYLSTCPENPFFPVWEIVWDFFLKAFRKVLSKEPMASFSVSPPGRDNSMFSQSQLSFIKLFARYTGAYLDPHENSVRLSQKHLSPHLKGLADARYSHYISGRHISVIDSFSRCNLQRTGNSAAPIWSGA